MTSEYIVDLCFIRPVRGAQLSYPGLETQMNALFTPDAACYIDRKSEDGLDIAVVQINGLGMWASEQEVIAHMEAHMPQEPFSALGGYRVQVIPKTDAGTCCMKR